MNRSVTFAIRHSPFALLLAFAALANAQQPYPVKPVRIVVPVAPGGGTDPQARLLARKFQESMGQSFVVENRTGAASMVGTEFVVRAPADGYTLLCAASTLAGANALRKDLPFDLLKDLAPVGQISSAATFLVVHPSVPVSSVRDFIALAKKEGGKLNAASGGNGSVNHLSLEMLKQRAGIQATHVAYKGSGPATIALMSGEVDFSFAGAVTSAPHIRSGRIKALGVSGKQLDGNMDEAVVEEADDETGLAGHRRVNGMPREDVAEDVILAVCGPAADLIARVEVAQDYGNTLGFEIRLDPFA